LSSASGTRPSTKIGFTTTNVTSSTKPPIGINPTSRVSNAKVSSTKPPIKSGSPTKVASLARVSSSTNKSGANKPLFISKEESSTKSPVKSGSTTKRVGSTKISNRKKAKSILPRQDALEPAIRRLPTLYIPIRQLAIAPTALECILEAFKPIDSNIDINIDLNNLDS
jgi:hypothetical protein